MEVVEIRFAGVSVRGVHLGWTCDWLVHAVITGGKSRVPLQTSIYTGLHLDLGCDSDTAVDQKTKNEKEGKVRSAERKRITWY